MSKSLKATFFALSGNNHVTLQFRYNERCVLFCQACFRWAVYLFSLSSQAVKFEDCRNVFTTGTQEPSEGESMISSPRNRSSGIANYIVSSKHVLKPYKYTRIVSKRASDQLQPHCSIQHGRKSNLENS
jgi:hypothetical protein